MAIRLSYVINKFVKYAAALSKEEAIKILGLSATESPTKEDIKKAYKAKILQHHPDRNENSDDATDKMKQINLAYSLLIGEGSVGDENNFDDCDENNVPCQNIGDVYGWNDKDEELRKFPLYKKITNFKNNHNKSILPLPISDDIKLYISRMAPTIVEFCITWKGKKIIPVNDILFFGLSADFDKITHEQRYQAAKGMYEGIYGKYVQPNGQTHFKYTNPELYKELSLLKGEFSLTYLKSAATLFEKADRFIKFMDEKHQNEYLNLLYGNGLPEAKNGSNENFEDSVKEYAANFFNKFTDLDKEELTKAYKDGTLEFQNFAFVDDSDAAMEIFKILNKTPEKLKDSFKKIFIDVIIQELNM